MASTLPSDIFDRILDFIALNIGVFDNYAFQEMKSYKHALAACSMICRYWSSRCRNHLFGYIVLRHPDDLDGFLTLLDQPVSNLIVSSVRVARTYEYKSNNVSWSHRILVSLTQKLPHIDFVHYQNHPKCRSALPPTFSKSLSALYSSLRHVRALALSQQDFNAFSDFSRIIRVLTSLKTLHCDHLFWAKSSSNPALVRGADSLTYISASLCKEHWPMVWLLLAPLKHTRGQTLPPSALLSVLGRISQLFDAAYSCNIKTAPNNGYWLLTCMTPGQKNLVNIAYFLETLGSDVNAPEHAGSSASVRLIEINVTPPPSEHAHDQTTIDGFLAYDWKALDVEVSRLTHLASP